MELHANNVNMATKKNTKNSGSSVQDELSHVSVVAATESDSTHGRQVQL